MTRAFGRKIGRRVMTEPDVNSDTSNDTEDKDFFNVFDGTKGRTESVYLDIQERITAEKQRAIAEGREPELSDVGSLPSSVGTPFVPKERQVDNSVYSNPSIAFTGEKDVDPVQTLPVSTGDVAADVDLAYAAQVARERSSEDDALLGATSGESVSVVPGAGEVGPSAPVVDDADLTTNEYTV